MEKGLKRVRDELTGALRTAGIAGDSEVWESDGRVVATFSGTEARLLFDPTFIGSDSPGAHAELRFLIGNFVAGRL